MKIWFLHNQYFTFYATVNPKIAQWDNLRKINILESWGLYFQITVLQSESAHSPIPESVAHGVWCNVFVVHKESSWRHFPGLWLVDSAAEWGESDPDLQSSVKMIAPAPTLGSLILLSLSVINAQAQGESSRTRVKIVSINIKMLEI